MSVRVQWIVFAALAAMVTSIAASERADASPIVRTARLGGVKAALTVVKVSEDGRSYFKLSRLQIFRSGRVAFDSSLPENVSATYTFERLDPDVLVVRQLDRSPTPQVIVQVYTGGAHCCTTTALYHYDAAKRKYVALVTDWGNGGYALKELEADPYLEFVGSDETFAYKFASYAGSGRPLAIFRFRGSKLVDVTRCYPKLIAAQAKDFWKSALEQKKDPQAEPNGVLAPYVADDYLLGRGDAAMREIRQFPSADAKFISELRAFLKQGGYIGGIKPDCAE